MDLLKQSTLVERKLELLTFTTAFRMSSDTSFLGVEHHSYSDSRIRRVHNFFFSFCSYIPGVPLSGFYIGARYCFFWIED